MKHLLLGGVVAFTSLVGCGASDERIQSEPGGGGDVAFSNSADTVQQTLIFIDADGNTITRTYAVPVSVARAELERKQELTAAALRGDVLPPPRLHRDPNAVGLGTLGYYGDIDACYGNDMWISSQPNGDNDVGTNTICFIKHQGGVGTTNLSIFFMPASAACPFGDYRVNVCAASFWAGQDSGAFGSSNSPARYFSAWQRMDNTTLGNWPLMSFN